MKITKNQNKEPQQSTTCGEILYHKIIFGKFYAKKNSYRHFWHRYTNKMITTVSANYSSWHKDAMKQLGCFSANGKGKKSTEAIDCQVILKCHFYNYDNRTRDVSNFLEGIQDLLVEAGILKDDNFKIVIGHDGTRMFVDKSSPRMEFWILKAE
jgi:Holliday junction resolvase RusA-like endonuclease